MRRTRNLYLKNPSLVQFYHKWRAMDSPLGTKLQEIERRYQKRLKGLFPHLSPAELQGIHAIIHGLITAPFLSEAGMAAGLKILQPALKG